MSKRGDRWSVSEKVFSGTEKVREGAPTVVVYNRLIRGQWKNDAGDAWSGWWNQSKESRSSRTEEEESRERREIAEGKDVKSSARLRQVNSNEEWNRRRKSKQSKEKTKQRKITGRTGGKNGEGPGIKTAENRTSAVSRVFQKCLWDFMIVFVFEICVQNAGGMSSARWRRTILDQTVDFRFKK